jgi:4'-phosphopantetheinyl transferase
MSIRLYLTFCEEFNETELERVMNSLSFYDQKKILTFRRREDKLMFLYGRLMLTHAIKNFNFASQNIKYSTYGRPYVDGRIDFNLSHSNGIVACVIGQDCKVGVDIEYQKSTEITDYRMMFSENEWRDIGENSNVGKQFYDIWTRKEAIMKADGRGISNAFSRLDTSKNQEVSLDGKSWKTYKVDLIPGFSCHVAFDRPINEIVISFLDSSFVKLL